MDLVDGGAADEAVPVFGPVAVLEQVVGRLTACGVLTMCGVLTAARFSSAVQSR
ncbi:hypothetical protein [Yinghuangia sp. YIM S09857]|uniref:hypothetical protein n=1 Tax=Yinghuangia sp. YIM S09857 TaxID=3436929 RepID=UPI003F52B36C